MEQISRSEKVAQMRKNNRRYKGYKNYKIANINSSQSTQANAKLNSKQQFSSFQLRLVTASFLFLLFLGIKETGFTYQSINYGTILEVVSNNNGMETAEEFMEEKVISVFNSLD